jgi:[amino group carrier protein]-L-2-aminoadipate 6-kinase
VRPSAAGPPPAVSHLHAAGHPLAAGPIRFPVVVKLGGSCVDDLSAAWWDDLAEIARGGLLLVHGWSGPLQRLDPRHATATAFLRDRYGNRSRLTTPEVLRDIETVSETVCTSIIGLLGRRGVAVQRITGSDGLLRTGPGERLWWQDGQLVEMDNLVGPITGVATQHLMTPGRATGIVVTPLAVDPRGRVVNTDADRAAAALAGAVGASTLVLVTNVPHFILDGKPVRHLTGPGATTYRDQVATGGMRKKLRAATEALDAGTGNVVLGNARVTDLLAGRSGTVITDRSPIAPTANLAAGRREHDEQ